MGKVVRRGEEVRQQALNILRNGGSLDEAAAATGFGRDYVRQLGAKEGIRFPRGKYGPHKNGKYDKELIVDLHSRGYSSKEAAEAVGCSVSYVLQTWKHAGLRKQLTPLQQKVKTLREQGKVSVEIAAELGIRSKNVITVANVIGLPFTEEEKKRSIAIGLEKTHEKTCGSVAIHAHGGIAARVASSKAFIETNYPEWEYVDGFIGSDGFMTIRHKTCKTETQKSAISVRRGRKTLICPECARVERAEREREREAEKAVRERMKQENKREKFWAQDFCQIAFKTCSICGKVHLERSRYCSEECQRKALNQYHDKRLNRAGKIDKTITLQKLYNRDGGVCWICGCKCDWDDYRTGEHDNKIAGNNYPSIDHFVPLAYGGNHTWDNVRLAHRRCNSKRGAKVVS